MIKNINSYKFIILIFFILTAMVSCSQSLSAQEEIYKKIRLEDNSYDKIICYFELIEYLTDNNKQDEVKDIEREILTYTKNKNLPIEEGLQYYFSGRRAQVNKEYSLALELYFKSIKYFEYISLENAEAKKMTLVLSVLIGNINVVSGHNNEAYQYYFSALGLAENLGNIEYQGIAYNGIGLMYNYFNDQKKSIEYFKNALDIFEDLERNEYTETICFNIAMSYFRLEQLDSLKFYTDKGFEINKKTKNESNLINLFRVKAMFFLEIENFKEAEIAGKKARDIAFKLDNKVMLSSIYHVLGMIAQEQSQWVKAEHYFSKGLETNNNLHNEYGNKYFLAQIAYSRQQFSKASALFQ